MARDLNPKCKYCRREGTKLFLKGERCNSAKCAVVKRNYPPGVHGPKAKRHVTGYGYQLREKQKVKRIYGILERQLRIYFNKSVKQEGDTGENLVKLLEKRLDNIIFRLGFAQSRNKARQLVSHGHFLVNDKKVDVPSFQVKINNVISLKKSSRDNKDFAGIEKKLASGSQPEWIGIDPQNYSGTILGEPSKDELKQPFDIKAVVEFYSR